MQRDRPQSGTEMQSPDPIANEKLGSQPQAQCDTRPASSNHHYPCSRGRPDKASDSRLDGIRSGQFKLPIYRCRGRIRTLPQVFRPSGGLPPLRRAAPGSNRKASDIMGSNWFSCAKTRTIYPNRSGRFKSDVHVHAYATVPCDRWSRLPKHPVTPA